jgi:predicted RNA-binding Zn-ribbon protein involved in translation (DUF1610 family)
VPIKKSKRSDRIRELQETIRNVRRQIEEASRFGHSLRRVENELASLTPCCWIVVFSLGGMMGVSFYGTPEVYPASQLIETNIDAWLSVEVSDSATRTLKLTLRVDEHGKAVFFFCPRAGAQSIHRIESRRRERDDHSGYCVRVFRRKANALRWIDQLKKEHGKNG